MLLTPEQKLWRAVLEQAYLDAEESAATNVTPRQRFRARSFLLAEKPEEATSLARVCDFAELPADRIVLWARERYAVAF